MPGLSPDVVLYDASGNPLAVANGAAVPTSSILVSGSDGTDLRFISTDASGRQVVVGAGTAGTATGGVITVQGVAGGTVVPVSGTVAVTQSTSPWVANITQFGSSNVVTGTGASGAGIPRVTVSNDSNILATQSGAWTATVTQPTAANLNATVVASGNFNNASVSATAASPPASATYAGASVTTSAPTYTTGQMDPLSLTTAGLLRIDGVYPVNATTPTTDITFTGGAVTTAAPAYTTGQLSALSLNTAGGLRVDGSGVTQPVSGSGNFTVVQATAANLNATVVASGNFNNASVSATGAAGPASATYVGGAVTTNAPAYTTGQMDPVSLTTTGLLRIDGVYPINATTPTTDGTFIAAAVTTASPAYTTGQMSALSLNTAGGLRVDGSAVTQPVSGTVTANQGTAGTLGQSWFAQITDATHGPVAVKAASTAAVATDQALVVAISPNNSISIAGSADATATGSLGALNATVQLAVTGENNAAMQLVAGTLVGTIVPEVSVDGGTTWVATFFDDPSTSNIVSSIVFGASNTATTRTIVSVGGASHVRIRVSLYTSGTATCNLRASIMQDPTLLSGGAAGAALPPVVQQMGGSVTAAPPSYTTATINALSLNTSGGLRVDGSAVTQPVSGTVAVTQSTSPWVANVSQFGGNNVVTGTGASGVGIPRVTVSNDSNILATQSGAWTATVTQATASNLRAQTASESATGAAPPTLAGLAGGSVTTAAPAYTTGQMSALSLDTTGNLRVLANQPTAANLNATVTASGNFNNASVSATAAAPPASATYIGASVTTAAPTYTTGQMDPLSVTTGGLLRIDGVYPINAATPTSDVTFIGGAVTTAAPAYTTGQLSALSLTTTGALRIDGSGVTQPVSGTVAVTQSTSPWVANITQFGSNNVVTGTGASGVGIPRVTVSNDSNILATQSGTWTVQPGNTANTTPWLATINQGGNSAAVKAASTAAVAADPALVVAISPNNTVFNQVADVTATGALGALNATVQVTLSGHTTAGFQLAAGTLVGTIVAEASFDGGTTWNATYMDTGNKVSSIVFGSANTAISATIVGEGGSGLNRIRVSAYTSGTANITLRASVVNDPSVVYGGQPNATTQPPTAAQIAGWDSATTTLRVPAVKAASTAPVATDQALVVVLSPNQVAIPVTTSPATSTPNLAFGDVTLAATGVTKPIERTTYTEQAANFTGSIKSASANDAAAGTGARTLLITYVDVTGATAGTETATLNGTTAVNLVTTTKCYIEKIEILTVGSTGSNVGIITLYAGAGGTGTVIGTIGATDNRTFWCHHYIITGKTCNVTDIMHGGNSAAGGSAAFIRKITLNSSNQVEQQISDTVTSGAVSNSMERSYGSTIQIPGPARVTMYCTPNTNASYNYRGSFNSYDQ